PKTLLEAVTYFADSDVATEHFARLRWPDGPVCPECGGKDLLLPHHSSPLEVQGLQEAVQRETGKARRRYRWLSGSHHARRVRLHDGRRHLVIPGMVGRGWAAAEEDLRSRGLLDGDGGLTRGRRAAAEVERHTDERGMPPLFRAEPQRAERLLRLMEP
ncbi:MAG: transposase, partial [Actinobacteria bacterium]|nr:transposase [Actinomycetota bacterium]